MIYGASRNPCGRPPRTIDQLREHLLGNRKIIIGGCWEWTGLTSVGGYGRSCWRGKASNVPRLAAMIWLDFDLGDSRAVCHHCDNPKCFNPAHLFVGTMADNVKDASRKWRIWNQKKTHCPRGHEYTPENTYVHMTPSTNMRSCRTCKRQRAAIHRASAKEMS